MASVWSRPSLYINRTRMRVCDVRETSLDLSVCRTHCGSSPWLVSFQRLFVPFGVVGVDGVADVSWLFLSPFLLLLWVHLWRRTHQTVQETGVEFVSLFALPPSQ